MNTAALDRFKSQLRDIRTELVAEFQSDANAVSEDVQAPGEVSSLPTHPADQDSEGIAERIALGELERNRIDEIDATLQRIEVGTFGRCENCGREISKQRLDAVPYTPYCIDCARDSEREVEAE